MDPNQLLLKGSRILPFVTVEDTSFWADKERIKVLIDLYEDYECLWKVQPVQYRNISKTKVAKVEIRKYLGWFGKWSYLPSILQMK